jgi:predicted transposase YdaD
VSFDVLRTVFGSGKRSTVAHARAVVQVVTSVQKHNNDAPLKQLLTDLEQAAVQQFTKVTPLKASAFYRLQSIIKYLDSESYDYAQDGEEERKVADLANNGFTAKTVTGESHTFKLK